MTVTELPMVADAQREDWLAWRRGGLGASDVAGVLGISPWASPYSVWVDKVHGGADDDNEAMEAGRMLEPAIGPWFTARTGLHVAGEQTWCTHPEEPWARATLDGFVCESPASGIDDALGGLEVKTTSESARKWETDGIPVHYAAQAQYQMWVTGMERTWFAVLHANFGLRLSIYELARDDDDIALIAETCRRFWHDRVVAGVAPPVDGHQATTEALRHVRADPDADAVELGAEARIACQAHHAIKRQIADLERALAEHDNVLRAALDGATEGLVHGERAVTWREQSSTRLDTKRLKAERPDVAAEFENTTTTRVLRVTTPKE